MVSGILLFSSWTYCSKSSTHPLSLLYGFEVGMHLVTQSHRLCSIRAIKLDLTISPLLGQVCIFSRSCSIPIQFSLFPNFNKYSYTQTPNSTTTVAQKILLTGTNGLVSRHTFPTFSSLVSLSAPSFTPKQGLPNPTGLLHLHLPIVLAPSASGHLGKQKAASQINPRSGVARTGEEIRTGFLDSPVVTEFAFQHSSVGFDLK